MEALPEGCVAAVLARTSPRDACRLSLVSALFKSAAESDAVWERFLPSDVPQSAISAKTKKELFLTLCRRPLLFDGGRKSFNLDRETGKKCYMLSARDLLIIWGDTPAYWQWKSIPESRFPEIAELMSVCWLEIRGKINLSMLSPNTNYKAYIVFKLSPRAYGFDYQEVEVSVGLVGSEGSKKAVYLDTERGLRRQIHILPRRFGPFYRTRFLGMQPHLHREHVEKYPSARTDGWFEMELGEFFNEGGIDGELEMGVMEVQGGHWKGGLIVEGIEIRPVSSK